MLVPVSIAYWWLIGGSLPIVQIAGLLVASSPYWWLNACARKHSLAIWFELFMNYLVPYWWLNACARKHN
jgi:hypothetical protein